MVILFPFKVIYTVKGEARGSKSSTGVDARVESRYIYFNVSIWNVRVVSLDFLTTKSNFKKCISNDFDNFSHKI